MFQQREFRFIFEWAHRPVIFSIIIQAFLVAAFGLIHSCHVSTMFENDTYFSHLTTLEREMIFRSEMGMYYSYYKRLVQAPSYLDGLIEIINDRKTEYPSVINSLQRFNLFPEVVIAALFRVSSWISKALDLKTIECWIVNRTYDDVTSCVGYGDPIYFYLYTVWACAGLTMSLIFLFGLELSGSILGGTFAVLCFMFNHSESTRIQWTPPLRESFGYPCSLWQMLIVTKFLRFANSYKGMVRNQQSLTNWLSNISRIMLPTTIFLILWQFSQFVITTQLLAVYLLYCFGVIGRQTCLTIAISVAGSIVVASVILFFNEFLLYSTLTFLAMAMVIVVHLDPLFERTKFSCAVLSTVSIAVLTLLLKFIYGNRDDAHIFNLLRTKFTDYKDFHTLLYTCSPEFDFMPASYLKKISQTLLMPTVVFNVIAVTWYWLMTVFHSSKRSPSAKVRSVVDPAIAYNFLQANAFAVMAALVMRLKLFLTPHLCLIASIIFHKQFLPRTPKPWFSALIALLVGGMTVQGYANIVHERNIIGEFTNTPLEELLTWIMDSTDTNAVFAGPMPVMANVMLSTGRQVVNHPHYEHAEARNRTLKAYSIFSRKSRYEVYDIMVKMHVQYVIIEDVWCFGVSKNGCSMGDLWDVQDPENMNQDLLCPALYRKSSFPFHKLFANGAYVVLKVDPQWSNSRLPSAIKIDQINVVNISISQNS